MLPNLSFYAVCKMHVFGHVLEIAVASLLNLKMLNDYNFIYSAQKVAHIVGGKIETNKKQITENRFI